MNFLTSVKSKICAGVTSLKKIMIVDDSLEFLEILSNSLSKKFKIYTALGVTEAINICKEEEIDVICSDLYIHNSLLIQQDDL